MATMGAFCAPRERRQSGRDREPHGSVPKARKGVTTLTTNAATPGIDWQGDPQLSNPDLMPTPVQQRTWTTWNYGALWMGMVHNIFNFSWMGGLIAIGMSVWQALAIALTGSIIMTALIGLNGRVGARHGIPFAVWCRSTFGVYGANIPAIIRALVAVGWFGVQSYLGATAVNLLLAASIGPWGTLGHTVVGGLGLNLWIAMVIYWAINILVLRRGMETVRRFESWAGPMIFVVMLALLIWAIAVAHGLGPLFQTHSKFTNTWTFLLVGFIPGVAVFISGSWASMVLNITDLTRFARSNREQLLGTVIGLPIAQIVFFVMAAIIVSTGMAVFGKAFWNPSDLLSAINNPALSIIGALLLAIATISVNIPANIVSPAYDFTNLLPKVLNFRSAGLVAIILAFVYMPWKLMENPATLYGVLNNIGAFLGPATGIIMADYLFVRKQYLDVPALYKTHGRYRASGGFNLVSLIVLGVVTGILLIGEFVPSVAWLYNYAWFLGLLGGAAIYLIVVQVVKALSGGLPESLEPAGSLGEELDELEVVAGTTD